MDRMKQQFQVQLSSGARWTVSLTNHTNGDTNIKIIKDEVPNAKNSKGNENIAGKVITLLTLILVLFVVAAVFVELITDERKL